MNLDEMAKTIHRTAKEKGFWDPMKKKGMDHFVFYAKQLAMIHSEATEVLEALRKDKGQEQIVEEIADIIIRTLDLYEGLIEHGVINSTHSLNDSLAKKAAYNITRPKMHGVAG
jgi:NTP pyrophosphatase (non-canonical NTP hydrolase)